MSSVAVSSSPTLSTTITHRPNKVSSLVNNRRPQSMLSARALMFDEPSASSFDRDLLKLSTSPKQQQHYQVWNKISDIKSVMKGKKITFIQMAVHGFCLMI